MPRKVPSSYLRKLNEEIRSAKASANKRKDRELVPKDPDSGRLKGFTMVCQACGTKARFTVDSMGYATCGNCKSVASYRFGNVA